MSDAAPKVSRYAYYVLGVLFFINFFNYVDRFVLNVVLDNVSHQLVQDPHIRGRLEGLLISAFTLGYMLAAPFAAGLGDRWLRTRIVAICCFVWSLATLGTAFSRTYVQLLVFRSLIGVGEAGFLAIGPTLVADYFPKTMRGTMLSIFYLGMPLGAPMGYILGEALSRAFAGAPGPFHGWRGAFFVVALPGFALASLAWFLREPARGQMDADAGPHLAHAGPPRFADYVRLFGKRTYLLTVLALTGVAASNGGMLTWFAEFLKDVKHIDKKVASQALGGIILLAGFIGNTLGGMLSDLLYAKTRKAHPLLACVAFLAGAPLLMLALVLPGRIVPLMLGFSGALFFFMCTPVLNTLIANVTPPQERATAYACAIFLMHAFGDLVSPNIFGALKDAPSIGLAGMFILTPIPLVLSGLACLFALRTVGRDIGEAQNGPIAPPPAPERRSDPANPGV